MAEQKQNNTESTDLSTEGVDVLTGVREENEFDGTPSPEEENEQNITPVAQPTTVVEAPVVAKQNIPETKQPNNTTNTETPATEKEVVIPKNNPDIKGIRTFRLDTAEAIQGQKTSMVKIVLAEQQKKTERGETKEPIPQSRKALLFGLISLSFISIASVAVYIYFPKITQTQNAGTNTVKQSTLLSSTKVVDISNQQDSTFFDEIAKRTPTLTGTVESITAFRLIDSETKKVVPIEDVLSQATVSVPDIFMRSLAPEYLFGVYFKEGNTPFIVLKNTFFQNAFAGMLAWENNLEEDLRPIINSEHPGPKILEKRFSDALIQNKQVRILRDVTGKELLLYTFTDQNTLLITTNRVALEALITKLTVVKVVR